VYLILDEVEDDDVNKEYSEETNKCNVLIAACKLITSDIVPKVNLFIYFF
jgi:cohesin complex subunit SA-1/2